MPNTHQCRDAEIHKPVQPGAERTVLKRLIYTEPTTVTRQDGTKWNGNLRYTIRPIQEAKEYYVERQMEAYARESLAQGNEETTPF